MYFSIGEALDVMLFVKSVKNGERVSVESMVRKRKSPSKV